MTPTITIFKTTPMDLRLMSEVMSDDSTDIAERFGIKPLRALWYNYRNSLICRSVFIDGNLCAIFGLAGVIFCDTGTPWICMTPETRQYPMRVAFAFKRELNKMLEMFPILEDYVEAENDKHIRFMELMDFTANKNVIKVGDINFRKMERRA